MDKRTWNFVDKFFNEDELQSYIVQNAVSIKRTEEIEAGKKVIYRCSKYRKYPECGFQVEFIFSYGDGITVSTSNEHYHAHRSSVELVNSLRIFVLEMYPIRFLQDGKLSQSYFFT